MCACKFTVAILFGSEEGQRYRPKCWYKEKAYLVLFVVVDVG